MPITADTIKQVSVASPHPKENPDEGLFCLNPEVELVCLADTDGRLNLQKGSRVRAWLLYDENGKYPNSVQLRGLIFWWELCNFELAS
ncbi:MAG: hypothetical protein WCT19_01200 [Candidatus Paceibacterota bacterium]